MNASTALSFAPSGPPYDPANPLARPIVFADIAERLSRTYRFGAVPGALSVLQFAVMGAEAIVNEGGSYIDAALFLHHDDHEFILGHRTRPEQDAAERENPGARAGRRLQRDKWDAAIFARFDRYLPPPSAWTDAQRAIVCGMDKRFQAAEALALFGKGARPPADHAARRPPKFCDRDMKAKGGPLGTLWPPGLTEERWLDAHRKFTGRSIR